MRRILVAVLLASFVLAAPVNAQLFPTSFPSPEPVTDAFSDTAPANPTPADLSSFAGGWWRHSFNLTIYANGSAEASWRTYQNCGPGVTTVCDTFAGNLILNGGHAIITFDSVEMPAEPRDWHPDAFAQDKPVFPGVQMPVAHGTVAHSTDPRRLREGPITLALLPYDTGALTQDGDGVLVCRPDDPATVVPFDQMTPEQHDRWAHRACGA